MNNRSKKFWIVRATVATLLAGVGALGCGCDAGAEIVAGVKTTTTSAVAEAVGGLISGAVNGVFGGLNSGS